MVEDRQRCLAAGMNDHVGKPVDDQRLLATLIKWTKPRLTGNASTKVNQKGLTIDESAGLGVNHAHFDFASAQRRLGDSRSLLIKLLRRFLEMPDAVSVLRQQASNDDRTDAIITAHSLKGVAGTLGAIGLEQAAMKLEKGFKAGNASEADIDEVIALDREARQIIEDILKRADVQ